MKTKTLLILLAILFLLSIAVSVYAYPLLPERVISHWDINNQPNGWSSRLFATLFMPLMTLGVTLLLLAVPYIDPLKKNIQLFKGSYNAFLVGFAAFMLYIHLLTTAINLGAKFPLQSLMLPVLGIFIFLMGIVIGRAKRNFFIGIRTPWTLSSDTVWAKTHQRGAIVYKVAGVLALFGIFSPTLGIWFFMVPLLAGSLYLVVYSYFLYQHEQVEVNN